MPILEFQCDKCEHEFEELVFHRDEAVLCPRCGSGAPRRLMSSFAVTGPARKAKASSCGSCHASPGKCSGCGSH
jgi:putative FmdB family regulatory protein